MAKPTEVRLVASLLTDGEWGSPEEAAKEIIRKLDDKRKADDKPWLLIRKDAGLFYGPYPTLGAARKAAAKAVSIHHDADEPLLAARLFTTIEEGQEER